MVRRLTQDGPGAIRWLAGLGVPFTEDDGELRIIRCGGASRPRLLQAGERTGAEMVKALRAGVRARTISIMETTRVVGFEPAADGWLVRTDDPEHREIQTRTLLLAAGGGLRGEADRLGSKHEPSDATPEVLETAVALCRGGAPRPWQRHPTGPCGPRRRVRAPGDDQELRRDLLDRDGNRFVDEPAPGT